MSRCHLYKSQWFAAASETAHMAEPLLPRQGCYMIFTHIEKMARCEQWNNSTIEHRKIFLPYIKKGPIRAMEQVYDWMPEDASLFVVVALFVVCDLCEETNMFEGTHISEQIFSREQMFLGDIICWGNKYLCTNMFDGTQIVEGGDHFEGAKCGEQLCLRGHILSREHMVLNRCFWTNSCGQIFWRGQIFLRAQKGVTSPDERKLKYQSITNESCHIPEFATFCTMHAVHAMLLSWASSRISLSVRWP